MRVLPTLTLESDAPKVKAPLSLNFEAESTLNQVSEVMMPEKSEKIQSISAKNNKEVRQIIPLKNKEEVKKEA
jgi:hypothetical protein